MKTLITKLTFLSLVLGLAFYLGSCSDDDDAAVQLNFQGDFFIASAIDNSSGTDVTAILGAALLADNACPNNDPIIRLQNGSSTTSGDLINACATGGPTEPGGTWSFAESSNQFTLVIIVDNMGAPINVPVTLSSVVINSDANGDVTTISGIINLSAVVPDLPNDLTLTIVRI